LLLAHRKDLSHWQYYISRDIKLSNLFYLLYKNLLKPYNTYKLTKGDYMSIYNQSQPLLKAFSGTSVTGEKICLTNSGFKTLFVEADSYGTGTVTVQVSWDGTKWHTLALADGTPATFTSDVVYTLVGGMFLYYRANYSGGTAANLTVVIQ
jgi:hypothetical protein